MPKRDALREIAEIRARREDSHYYGMVWGRKWALEKAFKKRAEVEPELLGHFPVALIALTESFFRLVVEAMINKGSTYASRAASLGIVKFDLDAVLALHGKQLTIGEYIAHQLSWSNLEQVDANISALLGESFLARVREVHDRPVSRSPKRMLPDPNTTLAGVARTFAARHIICHETPADYKIFAVDVEVMFKSCTDFLEASQEVISGELEPNAPRTQGEMNEFAGKAAADALARMQSRLDEVVKLAGTERGAMWLASHEAWMAYAKQQIELAGLQFEGGSMQPMASSNQAASLFATRADELEREIEHLKYWQSL